MLLGAASMIQMTATNTLIQTMTPDALRGRVMAIWFMILMGFAPVGSVIAGSITTAWALASFWPSEAPRALWVRSASPAGRGPGVR